MKERLTNLGRDERVRTALLCLLLFGLNVGVIHKLFSIEYAWITYSIEGTFIALTRAVANHGPGILWWPEWNLGIPFTHTYPPLMAWVAAAVSLAGRVSPARAYHLVCALAYCFAPAGFFLFVKKLSGHSSRAFLAAWAWSVLSPSAMLLNPIRTDAGDIFAPQRLRALIIYGAGPEILGVALVPLALLFFELAITRRKLRWAALTALLIGAVALSNAVALIVLVSALIALALVHGRRGVLLFAAVLPVAYLLVCRWLPPSLVADVRMNAAVTENADYRPSETTWLAMICAVALLGAVWRMTRDWRDRALRTAVLWSAIIVPVVVLSVLSGIHLLPQGNRLHLAMDMALLMTIVLAAARLPVRPGQLLAGLFLLSSAWLIVHAHNVAGNLIRPATTGENDYRLAAEIAEHFPDSRILSAGGPGYWINVLGDTPQFSGGHEQFNPNWMSRVALYQLDTGSGAGVRDGEICVLWLKAYGVQAIYVASSQGPAVAKPFQRNPAIFETLLPVEYRSGFDTVYRVPQRSKSLAHIVPESALVQRPPVDGVDVQNVQRYVSALEDSRWPPAEFTWTSLQTAQIHARLGTGEVLSVQTNYHPGWRASIAGKPPQTSPLQISKDGLGLLVIHPPAGQPPDQDCVIDLVFTGGAELAITRWLSCVTALVLAVILLTGFPRSSLLATSLALALLAGIYERKFHADKTLDRPPAMAPAEPQYSYLSMNDLRVAPQLGSGWYAIEDGSRRWMAREAHVILRPPAQPADFEIRFALPPHHVANAGTPLRLSVLLNDRLLSEAVYSTDGDYVLTKGVPPDMPLQGAVYVTLRWNKAQPPGVGGDGRELGAVVLGVGFKEPKP